jgi:hypothetical protein
MSSGASASWPGLRCIARLLFRRSAAAASSFRNQEKCAARNRPGYRLGPTAQFLKLLIAATLAGREPALDSRILRQSGVVEVNLTLFSFLVWRECLSLGRFQSKDKRVN